MNAKTPRRQEENGKAKMGMNAETPRRGEEKKSKAAGAGH
jgi:hypothetical protein